MKANGTKRFRLLKPALRTSDDCGWQFWYNCIGSSCFAWDDQTHKHKTDCCPFQKLFIHCLSCQKIFNPLVVPVCIFSELFLLILTFQCVCYVKWCESPLERMFKASCRPQPDVPLGEETPQEIPRLVTVIPTVLTDCTINQITFSTWPPNYSVLFTEWTAGMSCPGCSCSHYI